MTITDAGKQAAQTIMADFSKILKAEPAKLMDFASRYGPAAVEWAIGLAQAKLQGDTDSVDMYEQAFIELKDDVLADLATESIVVQAQAEQTLLTTLRSVGTAAVSSILLAI